MDSLLTEAQKVSGDKDDNDLADLVKGAAERRQMRQHGTLRLMSKIEQDVLEFVEDIDIISANVGVLTKEYRLSLEIEKRKLVVVRIKEQVGESVVADKRW